MLIGVPGVRTEISRGILVFKHYIITWTWNITWSTRCSWLLQVLKTEIPRGNLVFEGSLGLREQHLEHASFLAAPGSGRPKLSLKTKLPRGISVLHLVQPVMTFAPDVVRLVQKSSR